MSMPALLRNPRVQHSAVPPSARQTRDGFVRGAGSGVQGKTVGRRRERRSENSRFASNPHMVRPSPADFSLVPNHVRSTFSSSTIETLHEHLIGGVENAATPTQNAACFDLDSAIKGQFTLSLRDAQQVLRSRLGCAHLYETYMHIMETQALSDCTVPSLNVSTFGQVLIFTVQREILDWLRQTVHVPSHDSLGMVREILVRDTDGKDDSITELRRTPTSLLWQVNDTFSRLAVHCVARTFNCPSFSRDMPTPTGEMSRATWILHPNPLLRGTQTRRGIVRRPFHRRNSSASTAESVSSSVSVVQDQALGRITIGLLQHATTGIETPPTTESELTDSVDDAEDDDSVFFASESEM